MTGSRVRSVTVVIPVFNEARTVAELVRRVLAVSLPGLDRDVLLIDDGSSDETPQIMARLAAEHPDTVSVLRTDINYGKGGAIRLGVHHAKGDVILLQDADLELSPEDHPRLVEPIVSGRADVVYGTRFGSVGNRTPIHTRLGNMALVTATNLLFGERLTDVMTGFKVFRRDLVRGLALRGSRFEIETEITARLLRQGTRIEEVSISYDPRTVSGGKKIRAIDAIDCLATLFAIRFRVR